MLGRQGEGLVVAGIVLNGESGAGVCNLASSAKESVDSGTGESGDVRKLSMSLSSSASLSWSCSTARVLEFALVIL